MAEAVRKKRIRTKKSSPEKCSAIERDLGREDTDPLEDLSTHGDIPLPPDDELLNVANLSGDKQEEKQLLLSSENAGCKDGTEKVVVEDDLHKNSESPFNSKSSTHNDYNNVEEHLKTQELEDEKSADNNECRAQNFTHLQRHLESMEPYLQLQNELNELKLHDKIDDVPLLNKNISTVSQTAGEPTASAPELCMDDVVVNNNPCLQTNMLHHQEEVNKVPKIKTKITLPNETEIEPMTEIQIISLYQNNELEENKAFITQFIAKERNIAQSEFYQLVLGYLRARTNLIGTQRELSAVLEEYNKQKNSIWVFEKRSVSEEGECEDNRLLTVTHEYEEACYKDGIAVHVSKQLKQIRDILSETYGLNSYSAEMCKLQAENYMQKVLCDCPEFMQIPKNAKITVDGRNDHDPQILPHVQKLKTCISVLFDFQRRGVKDQEFIRVTRQWLTDLVAILQRVATYHDHLFILNHVIRCPAGVGSWASSYIQIGGPWQEYHNKKVNASPKVGSGMLGCWPLDHSLTVLSTILNPTASREEFLHHLHPSPLHDNTDGAEQTSSDQNSSEDNVWVVVDSSGEEEEDPSRLWVLFTENDVVQILNQVPFQDIFQHILLIEEEDEVLDYNVSCTSRHGLLKLFAFATSLINLFRTGLATYSQVRYRGVVKRLCRFLRHTIEYVTDHWQNFLLLHQSSHHGIENDQVTDQWASLQVEYDQLFERAVHNIFSSPRSGAWQFLAVIPYSSVSLLRLWKIVYKLHVGVTEESDKVSNTMNVDKSTCDDWAALVAHSDTQGQFHDLLLKLEENEAFYLLTALANMAITRETVETQFVHVIVTNIYEATFVNEGTREMLSRIGRDLLSVIASSHPFSISYILTITQEKLSNVGGMSLYLFRALPLEVWKPSEEDIVCISHWLLFTPVPSVENQLARIILTKLNWGERLHGRELALPYTLHQRIALTVLEAYSKVSREMSQRSLLTESVKQVTSVMYAGSPEQTFCDWSWDLLTCLRLHKLDQPELLVRSMLSSSSSILAGIADPTSAAIKQSSIMNPVKCGLIEKQPLALFSALLLTTWGHSLPEFCEHGVDCVHELVVQGRYEAAITALTHILPLFFSQPEDISSHAKLMSVFQKCLLADQSYLTLAKSLVSSAFPGKILNLFSSMIIYHIKNYVRYGLSSGIQTIRFWIQVLICIPDWVHNTSVLYLLDTICHLAFNDTRCWIEVLNGFSEVMKNFEEHHNNGGGGISGLLSWFYTGTTAPNSLLVRASSPQFPWYTLAVLILETQQELKTGLWKHLQLELHGNPQMTLEEALKKVSSELNLGSISSSLLSIYRWGQQVIDLPADHPALPITLQMYMMLHLSRVPPQSGQYECCSVIMKFYQGYVNSLFLGKIKNKAKSAFDNIEARKMKEVHSLEEEDELETIPDNHLEETSKLLNAIVLWLDEGRLYDSNVYLPALPPHLLPQKLMLIFQNNWEPWPEAVDYKEIERAAQSLLKIWAQHRNAINKDNINSSPCSTPGRQHKKLLAQESHQKKNPKDSILKRLKTYEPPQPPPPIPPLSPLHLPHINDATLIDSEALLYVVHRYTDVTVEHSQTVSLWCREMCALDCVYRELLPQLWTNVHTKKIMTAECIPPKVGRKQPDCTGHASIVVEFSEARLSEGINARVDQNREQYESVFQRCQKPPPLQLCQAAVSLESVITVLVNEFRKLDRNQQNQKWTSLLMSGRKLFYHIVQLTSDDTNFYPPAKQLITSCAEVLGHEFISGHDDCQKGLVAQVLEGGGHYGGLLAPHFTPGIIPNEVYLTLYASLSSHALVSPDHTFMLLSKFDIERWLIDKQPNNRDQSQLVNAVGAALASLLPQAPPNLMMVLELYRVHLRSLLNHRFPEHYIEVLNVLLQVSAISQESCKEVTIGMWCDMLNVLAVGIVNFFPDMDRATLTTSIKDYAQVQTKLSPTMVKDTLKMLSTYFVRKRLEFGLYGLYPKYRLHAVPIATFLGMVSHVYIITELHKKWGEPKVLQEVWSGVEGLWAAWVAPLSGRDRESGPAWLRELIRDVRLLLPWGPSDAETADILVYHFAASLKFIDELLPDNSAALSMMLEYYSITFAMKEVKTHVLSVVHAHLSALPWHHLHPSLQDAFTFAKVVEQYLPECHSFIGSVLIQINWVKVTQSVMPSSSDYPRLDNIASNDSSTLDGIDDPLLNAAKLHQCLLNLLVRISMEPSVRQSSLLQTLLLDAESFSWWLIDGDSYQRVVNWWVMSCDPRIILCLPERNPVDVAIIQLLHRAAGYTPDTSMFHQDTGSKRSLLIRAQVRLLTSAAARYKSLVAAKPQVFNSTILGILTHMEDTLIGTLPKDQQWSEGSTLSNEVLALVSGGASSGTLQELACVAIVDWLSSHTHPSPGLLFPLLITASRTILHLNHRNPIIQAGLSALFMYSDWSGWEGDISWAFVISSLTFPLTNPSAMLNLASQEGHLLVIYAYVRWQRHHSHRCGDSLLMLSSLIEMVEGLIPNETMELGLVLVQSEILELVTLLVKENGPVESVWQQCSSFNSRLAILAEDRSSSGILAAIGLGRQSPLSPGVRLICRCLSTFLNIQMPTKGVFRTHPQHVHSEVDGTEENGVNKCTLEQLRALSTNATYSGLVHPLTEAIQFIEDPAHCLADVHILLVKLVSAILPDPLLRHLTIDPNTSATAPSAPPPSIMNPEELHLYLPLAPPENMIAQIQN